MALFGSLREMTLAELLPLLARKTGVLEVILPGRPKVGISFKDGHIQEVREGKRSLDPLEARALLMELLYLKEGSFEFHPGPVQKGFNWRVEGFLLLTATLMDELSGRKEELPHPKTRFTLKAGVGENLLDEPLLSFWNKAKTLLKGPQSVETLAENLNLPPDHVAYYLHKLRLLGLVEPYRAVERAEVLQKREGLLNRLFNGVRRLLGGEA